MMTNVSKLRRAAVGLVGGAALVLPTLSVGDAQPPPKPAWSVGTTDSGVMRFRLYRGALLPSEFTIYDTPNCDAGITVTLAWSEAQNWVRLRLKGKNVLHPHPSLDRTPGVDYFPNPFFPESEDIQDGRYQLWLIGQAPLTTYYYDATTLDLLGSEWDFPPGPPPPGTIPIDIPTANLVATDFFVPDEDGDIDFVQEWAYDEMVRGDRPDRAHVVSTFLPHSLCVANPFRVDLSTTRPYATPALPASEALTFRDYLNGGLMFDLTLEPSSYHTEPPIATNIGVYSAIPSVGGQIPPGWSLDFDALFGNVTPPIKPFPGQGSCSPYFVPQHIGTFNQCQGPPPGP